MHRSPARSSPRRTSPMPSRAMTSRRPSGDIVVLDQERLCEGEVVGGVEVQGEGPAELDVDGPRGDRVEGRQLEGLVEPVVRLAKRLGAGAGGEGEGIDGRADTDGVEAAVD